MPNVNGSYKYPHPDHPGKWITRQAMYQRRKLKAGCCPKCGRKKRTRPGGKVLAGLCNVCYPRVRVSA